MYGGSVSLAYFYILLLMWLDLLMLNKVKFTQKYFLIKFVRVTLVNKII